MWSNQKFFTYYFYKNIWLGWRRIYNFLIGFIRLCHLWKDSGEYGINVLDG